MNYLDILNSNEKYCTRKKTSESQLCEVRKSFAEKINIDKFEDITIYCGGSLGRGDVGNNSDLDLFILYNKQEKDLKRLDNLKILSDVISINEQLKYPEFSNDGQFIKVYSFPSMLKTLGSPKDDNENLFTARMLLLLESKYIINDNLYNSHIKRTIEHYFRDSRGRSTFKPLFLLNDLLRFWRTLCLNYELIRDNPERPWRKKNINLKFSRMLTVFATVLPIISDADTTDNSLFTLVNNSPLERLAIGLDYLNDSTLQEEFEQFLDNYEHFLKTKEDMGQKLTIDDTSLDKIVREKSQEFSEFFYKCLTHENIKPEYKRYLIL